MGKVLFFMLALISLVHLLPAQQLSGLVSEEISFYQNYTASSGSWTPEQRTLYQYNTKGQKSYAIYMAWDPSSETWKISSESDYSYDWMGRQVRSHSKDYDHYPDIVSGETETRTYFAPWTSPNYFEQTGNYYRKIDYETETEEIREQNCMNDSLMGFSSCRYYQFYRDKNSIREETRNITSESDEGLKASWTVSRNTVKENKKTTIFADSTVEFYQEEISGVPFQTDYYHSEYSEPYHLIRQEKREYEYNDQQQMVADRTWRRIPGEEWSLLYETLNTYDALGNQTESVFKDYRDPFPHFSRRTIFQKEMTDQGEIVIYTRYHWNSGLDQWVPYEKSGSIYSEQAQYYISWWNWNVEVNEFTHMQETWWSWYENDQEYKNIIRNSGYDLVTEIEFDYTVEQGRKKRCDGETIEEYDLLVSGTPESEFLNRQTTFSYFDLAECEGGQPASAISVFPNPSTGLLNIYAEERLGPCLLSITDVMGKQVHLEERELTNYTLIDLEHLTPGIYYLQISNGILKFSGKIILRQ